MNVQSTATFSQRYAELRQDCSCVREDRGTISEHTVQAAWHDQAFSTADLRTHEGHRLQVISPGWWNHQEGPDFRGAQIEFNGRLYTGDVEVHLHATAWTQHGHHRDPRYEDVILHAVLYPPAEAPQQRTATGRALPTLVLRQYLHGRPLEPDQDEARSAPSQATAQAVGRCAQLIPDQGTEPLQHLLHIAGEWRLLNKARAVRERIDQAGADQAIYEAFMYACGLSQYKHHFADIARQLPYDRVRQLALQDALLLETALLQLAGLLPESLPAAAADNPHFARLCALRGARLGGLRSLPLAWDRAGVRPQNSPERRLAGAARFLARTANPGLAAALESRWREPLAPLALRRELEGLFPRPMGFWAEHCTWTGKRMRQPAALLGAGRVRAIIGNAFVPAALALARRERDRAREEQVHAFFCALPREPENQITKRMLPRVLGETGTIRLDFRAQQGLLQMHEDWCEPNPSCRNCSLLRYLESGPP